MSRVPPYQSPYLFADISNGYISLTTNDDALCKSNLVATTSRYIPEIHFLGGYVTNSSYDAKPGCIYTYKRTIPGGYNQAYIGRSVDATSYGTANFAVNFTIKVLATSTNKFGTDTKFNEVAVSQVDGLSNTSAIRKNPFMNSVVMGYVSIGDKGTLLRGACDFYTPQIVTVPYDLAYDLCSSTVAIQDTSYGPYQNEGYNWYLVNFASKGIKGWIRENDISFQPVDIVANKTGPIAYNSQVLISWFSTMDYCSISKNNTKWQLAPSGQDIASGPLTSDTTFTANCKNSRDLNSEYTSKSITIKIKSPSIYSTGPYGPETWIMDQSKRLDFTIYDGTPVTTLQVWLKNVATNSYYYIKTYSDPEDWKNSSHSITVPNNNTVPAGNYRVEFRLSTTTTALGAGQVALVKPNLSLIALTPTSTATWIKGTSYPVTWSSLGLNSNKISVTLKNTVTGVVNEVATNLSNTGSTNITAPFSFIEGNYKLEISTDNTNVAKSTAPGSITLKEPSKEAPGQLTAIVVSPYIKLTWIPPYIGFTGVISIHRDGVLITRVGGTEYTDTSVIPGQSYTYQVSAVFTDRTESAKSIAVTQIVPVVRTITALTPISNQTWTSDTSYPITWTSTGATATTSVNVWLKDVSTGTYYNLISGLPNTGSATVTIPDNGTIPVGTYSIEYRFGPAIKSVAPGLITISTPLLAPTGLVGKFIVAGQIRLDWILTSDVKLYRIYRDGVSIGIRGYPIHDFTDLVPSEKNSYVYEISAYYNNNPGKESLRSAPITVTIPKTITALDPATNVNWSKGLSYLMTWQSTGATATTSVNVWLKSVATGTYYNLIMGLPNTGSAFIQIPNDQVIPTDTYTIEYRFSPGIKSTAPGIVTLQSGGVSRISPINQTSNALSSIFDWVFNLFR
jgi:hypothetical protein